MSSGRRELAPTERRLQASEHLDEMSALEIVTLLNTHDALAVAAVERVLPDLAQLIELASARFAAGGNVHYFGAGTSGRLGVLDAAELLPTFNLEPHRVTAHLAGGAEAVVHAVENAEDSWDSGAIAGGTLSETDVAIGLAASGNTPYVGGALHAARALGALTVLISCNPDAVQAEHADMHLCLETGQEVLTGSTRMKAATAQKLVLNAFSTGLMILDGRTWSNLMVSLVATNEKLRDRTVRILREATGLGQHDALAVLTETDGDLKCALVAELANVPPARAREALEHSAGSVRRALASLGSPAA